MQTALVHKPSGRVALIFKNEPREGEYERVPVVPPEEPTGNRRIGFVYNRELNVVDTYFEEKTAPPASADKLDRLLNIVGLTKEELKALLGVTAARAITTALIEEVAAIKEPGIGERIRVRAEELVREWAGAPPAGTPTQQ